jgi:propionyl-CoA synthetase
LIYEEVYRRSMEDPEGFWAEAAEAIDWERRWDRVLDATNPPFYRWFRGARLSTCHNALDRHIGIRGSQPALIYDSPVTGQIRHYSYRQLRDDVALAAGAFRRQGVGKGDRVLIYMPMVPEAVMAMLAASRLGAIHSVVFGGFAAHELANRIDDCKPKLIISASCGIEAQRIIPYKGMLDRAIEIAKWKPRSCLILQREVHRAELITDRDYDWNETLSHSETAPCQIVDANDPLYILYTSGTTGAPKGIVRDNGGHAVALCWSMKNVIGLEPGQVFFAASDVGWTVGHSYTVYGPLLYGGTTVLFEGKPVGTPDASAYWRVVSRHCVSTMFVAPTALRAIRQEDPEGAGMRKYDLSKLHTLFIGGERADSSIFEWTERHLKVPIVDHWWQTETGWPITANCVGLAAQPYKRGSANRPVPGWRVSVLDSFGQPCKPSSLGALCLKLPLAPGSLQTIWNADHRYVQTYLSRYPGYYDTADAGYIDENGYVYVMTRVDDVINVAGHRLSTGAIEEVLASHPDVAECAVIGISDSLKGQVPLGLLVLRREPEKPPAVVCEDVVKLVRERIGPVACLRTVVEVTRLPKTRSGKVLRATLKSIANGEEYDVPSTIDDPMILSEINDRLKSIGRRPDGC